MTCNGNEEKTISAIVLIQGGRRAPLRLAKNNERRRKLMGLFLIGVGMGAFPELLREGGSVRVPPNSRWFPLI